MWTGGPWASDLDLPIGDTMHSGQVAEVATVPRGHPAMVDGGHCGQAGLGLLHLYYPLRPTTQSGQVGFGLLGSLTPP